MEERTAQTVVTGETLLAFQEERLGLNTEPVEEVVQTKELHEDAAEEPAEEPVEPQEDETEEHDEHKAKVKNRFVKLREQRNQARELAAQEAAKRTEYEAKIKELEDRLNPPAPVIDTKPDPNKYTDLDVYTADLEKWADRKARQEIERTAKEKIAAEQKEQLTKSWNKRMAEVKAEIDDFDDVVSGSTVMVSDQVRDAIFESDVGPKILYHLAENPGVAEKIAKMTVTGALREIGRLEERLQTPQKASPVKSVQVSKAPPPITPIRTEGTVTDESDGENVSIHRYKELRKAGKIR